MCFDIIFLCDLPLCGNSCEAFSEDSSKGSNMTPKADDNSVKSDSITAKEGSSMTYDK